MDNNDRRTPKWKRPETITAAGVVFLLALFTLAMIILLFVLR